mgnify:FL=1
MAITYHAGRRIQGTPTYLDNFEYASQSTADAKWIPATTLVRVNVTNNTLGYTIERHTTNDTCYYDLGTANISETKWVCRFKLVTTGVNGGGTSHKMGFFGLSSGTGNWSTSVDKIGFHHQISSNPVERDIHPAYDSNGNYGAGSQAELSTQVVAGTHYYELSRLSSSEYRITISSTDAYNGNVEDETYTNLSGITGLQYFVIVNANDYTISGSLVGYIDDLKFYNGVTSISSGNVQLGSRYEETDTRKTYHYADLTYGGFPKFWAEEGVAIGTYPPTRGVWASGYTNTPSNQPLNTMDYVTIASHTGTATDFGDLTTARGSASGVSSYTRGVIAGGDASAANIEFITIMTKSNSSNFGDLTTARENVATVTDRSRGMWIAGGDSGSTVIDYVTISTRADATTFGTLATTRRLAQGVNDGTIGLVGGGYTTSASSDVLKFTIQTLGNGTSFGSLSSARYNVATVSSQTRGVWAGGQAGVDTDMDYRTIAGNSTTTTFGSLNTAQTGANGNSDLTRGVIAGGWVTSLMQVITIDTGSGGATTYGSLSLARDHPAGGLEG